MQAQRQTSGRRGHWQPQRQVHDRRWSDLLRNGRRSGPTGHQRRARRLRVRRWPAAADHGRDRRLERNFRNRNRDGQTGADRGQQQRVGRVFREPTTRWSARTATAKRSRSTTRGAAAASSSLRRSRRASPPTSATEPSSEAPATAPSGTGADLGESGNLKPQHKSKNKNKKKKREEEEAPRQEASRQGDADGSRTMRAVIGTLSAAVALVAILALGAGSAQAIDIQNSRRNRASPRRAATPT